MPESRPDLGSLLDEPLLTVCDAAGARASVSLPQALARLSDPHASTIAFSAAQAHQSHALHAFLVQLAAMACARTAAAEPSTDPGWWQAQLLALSGGSASAWTLVVADLGQPAFLQPPVPEGTIHHFTMSLPTPGSVDTVLLIPARNHDYKLNVGNSNCFEAWAYSLISTQTQMGYILKYNGGIFRMNKGNGNRPGIGLRTGFDLGKKFRRDLEIVQKNRDNVILNHNYAKDGLALLWCMSWDGKSSLAKQTLDPWCIECCRRLRLVAENNRIRAKLTPNQVARVEMPETYKGNSGDPWTPIDRKANKSLTLSGSGFTYRRVADLLLSPDWEPAATQEILPGDDADLWWYGRALVRGQGKTEGWHERDIPIDRRLRNRFANRSEREELGKRAQEMITAAGVMRLGILKPALLTLWGEAAGRVDPGLRQLEERIDGGFFPALWEADADPARWREQLTGWAREILATHSAAQVENASRWRRISLAHDRFDFGLHRKTHKELKNTFLPRVPVSVP
jgi:CRISPR system Cascade subunit CasA